MKWSKLAALATVVGLVAVVGVSASVSSASTKAGGAYGENFNAPPALLMHAFGTTKGVPQALLAGVTRAAVPFTGAKLALAIKCWKDGTCDTGTGGKLTVAMADGFGDNVWREVTHMEFVLQALTYPTIGKIIYTNGHANTQKQIADLRSLIAQKVNIIVGFPDAGAAVLPTYRQATAKGIVVVPYVSGPTGTAGKDYLTMVSEDLCQLGKNFADVLNKYVGTGKVAFLAGTPGNGLSKAWQACAKPALAKTLTYLGSADTNWTREGTLAAVSAFISKNPDIKGYAYEYSDGFLGAIRAYQAAKKPLDIVFASRTDEESLFCEWKKIGNAKFQIFYSSGGGFDSRFALTAAMMKLAGATIPPALIVPINMHKVTAATCNPKLPAQAPASTLVPNNVLAAMYPAAK